MQCYFKATIQKREQIQLGKLSKIIEEHIPDLQISKSLQCQLEKAKIQYYKISAYKETIKNFICYQREKKMLNVDHNTAMRIRLALSFPTKYQMVEDITSIPQSSERNKF